jgi:amidase
MLGSMPAAMSARSCCGSTADPQSSTAQAKAMPLHPSEYARLDAVGLAGLVRSGEISAREATELAISAIERLNPKLNAVVLTDFERALATADRVDRSATLAGVPFLVKDVDVFVTEWPTTFSSRYFAGAAPRPDSEIVRRWRSAGLVLLGKTNTPEFAEDFVTEPTFRGVTLNPWNPAVTVGGSSGGAAAAVASGMVPAAHGTDVGGSIRVPAACCGLFGMKPTRGLNPIGPHYPELGAGLDCEHVLTRTVRDSAAFLDATAGPEPGGRYHVARSVPSYVDALQAPVEALRIACITRPPSGGTVDSEVSTAIHAAAGLLDRLGHEVVTCEFPPEVAALDEAVPLWMMDVALEIRRRAKEIGRGPAEGELELLSWAVLKRTDGFSALDYLDARQRAHDTSVAMARRFEAFDLILTPSLATLPLAVGQIDIRSPGFDYDTWSRDSYGFAPFSEVFNVTGQPAASLPLHVSKSGLPIGIQLAARQGEDHLLLAFSARLEAECPWASRRPAIWAGRG